MIIWFFAPSFQVERNTSLADASPFNLVIILKEGTANNTLTSHDNHPKREDKVVGHLGDADMLSCLSKYFQDTTGRMRTYAASGPTFNINDTYAMESICAFKTGYLVHSEF